jgi:hypothetical protein
LSSVSDNSSGTPSQVSEATSVLPHATREFNSSITDYSVTSINETAGWSTVTFSSSPDGSFMHSTVTSSADTTFNRSERETTSMAQSAARWDEVTQPGNETTSESQSLTDGNSTRINSKSTASVLDASEANATTRVATNSSATLVDLSNSTSVATAQSDKHKATTQFFTSSALETRSPINVTTSTKSVDVTSPQTSSLHVEGSSLPSRETDSSSSFNVLAYASDNSSVVLTDAGSVSSLTTSSQQTTTSLTTTMLTNDSTNRTQHFKKDVTNNRQSATSSHQTTEDITYTTPAYASTNSTWSISNSGNWTTSIVVQSNISLISLNNTSESPKFDSNVSTAAAYHRPVVVNSTSLLSQATVTSLVVTAYEPNATTVSVSSSLHPAQNVTVESLATSKVSSAGTTTSHVKTNSISTPAVTTSQPSFNSLGRPLNFHPLLWSRASKRVQRPICFCAVFSYSFFYFFYLFYFFFFIFSLSRNL